MQLLEKKNEEKIENIINVRSEMVYLKQLEIIIQGNRDKSEKNGGRLEDEDAETKKEEAVVKDAEKACTNTSGKGRAKDHNLFLKDKLFFSKVENPAKFDSKVSLSSSFNVQYLQTPQDPKRKTHEKSSRCSHRHKKAAVSQKSNTRRISCKNAKGGCRHRRKLFTNDEMKSKHTHRHTDQKPHVSTVAITSCVDLTNNAGNLKLGIRGINPSSTVLNTNIVTRPNVNQPGDGALSATNVGLPATNGGARFSSAHVLQTKIVARRTPFVKPNLVNNTTPTDDKVTLTTDSVETQKESSVAVNLESQDFDAVLSTSSFDTALETECSTSEDIQREEFENQVPVSAGLIKDSLDPVLTVCNLPPVLITSNVNLGSARSTPKYNRGLPNPSSHAPQHKMHEKNTEMLPRDTRIYLEDLTSVNTAKFINPTASTSSLEVAVSDLKSIQHDERPVSIAIIPGNNMDSVQTVCNLPTLLITGPVDEIADIRNSAPHLQPQESQIKRNIEILPHNVQYVQQQQELVVKSNIEILPHNVQYVQQQPESQVKPNIEILPHNVQYVQEQPESQVKPNIEILPHNVQYVQQQQESQDKPNIDMLPHNVQYVQQQLQESQDKPNIKILPHNVQYVQKQQESQDKPNIEVLPHNVQYVQQQRESQIKRNIEILPHNVQYVQQQQESQDKPNTEILPHNLQYVQQQQKSQDNPNTEILPHKLQYVQQQQELQLKPNIKILPHNVQYVQQQQESQVKPNIEILPHNVQYVQQQPESQVKPNIEILTHNVQYVQQSESQVKPNLEILPHNVQYVQQQQESQDQPHIEILTHNVQYVQQQQESQVKPNIEILPHNVQYVQLQQPESQVKPNIEILPHNVQYVQQQPESQVQPNIEILPHNVQYVQQQQEPQYKPNIEILPHNVQYVQQQQQESQDKPNIKILPHNVQYVQKQQESQDKSNIEILPHNVQYVPQQQESQDKPNIEILSHNVQYDNANSENLENPTEPRCNDVDLQCSATATECFQNIPSQIKELNTDGLSQNLQCLNKPKGVPDNVTSLELHTATECSTPQYNMNKTDLQGSKQKTDTNINSEEPKNYGKYLKPDLSVAHSQSISMSEPKKDVDCSASPCKRRISLATKISQCVKRDLEARLLLRRKQSQKLKNEIADSVNKDNMDLNRKTECDKTQHSKFMQRLQGNSAKRNQICDDDDESDHLPPRKHLKADTIVAHTLTGFDMDIGDQSEDSQTLYDPSMPSLEADISGEISVETKEIQACDTQLIPYLKPQTPASVTILMTDEEIPIDTPKVIRRRRRRHKDFPILGIVEDEILETDLPKFGLDAEPNIVATSRDTKEDKEATVNKPSVIASSVDLASTEGESEKPCLKEDASALSISQAESDKFDAIFNDVQKDEVDNKKQYPEKETTVLSVPIVDAIEKELHKMFYEDVTTEAEDVNQLPKKDVAVLLNPSTEAIDNTLDATFIHVQTNVVENENQSPEKDNSNQAMPKSKAVVGDNLDNASNGVQRRVDESEVTYMKQDTSILPVPTVEAVFGDDLDDISDDDEISVVENEKQCAKKDTSILLESNVEAVGDSEVISKHESKPAWPQPGTSHEDTLDSSNEETSGELNPGSKYKCQFFRSARGKRMLSVNGIRYRVNNISADKVRWRCSSHERYGCKAKLHTIGNKIVYFVDEHVTFSIDESVDDLEPYAIIGEESKMI